MSAKFFSQFAGGCFLLMAPLFLSAQVAVNTDGSTADPSAMIDVKSTSKGALIPRMTTTQRTGISNPATGLLVFDTDSQAFWFYTGSDWEQLLGASMLPGPSVITPPILTAPAHNYNPTGFGTATVVRVSGNDGFHMITGFNAGIDGEEKTIVNVGNYPIYLAPEHQSSTAANRIAYFEEVIIPQKASCRILYDGTAARWRPVDPPCPNYFGTKKSLYYDRSAGKVAENFQDDINLDVFGSLQQTSAPPSATSPFTAWNLNTGTAPSGGLGLFYPRSSEEMVYVGKAHIATQTHLKTPSGLSDNTNSYYFFLRIADFPSSGFWNQNNSLGLRYWHTASGGNWECYARDGSGGETVVDSGVPFAVNTEYELLVTLNKSNTEATFFINGAVVGRINTNLPSPIAVGVSLQQEKVSGTGARAFLIYRFMGAAIAP